MIPRYASIIPNNVTTPNKHYVIYNFKGFFDPNTEENLSYLDLLGRCVTDPSSELSFMCLTPDGVALSRFRRNNRQ